MLETPSKVSVQRRSWDQTPSPLHDLCPVRNEVPEHQFCTQEGQLLGPWREACWHSSVGQPLPCVSKPLPVQWGGLSCCDEWWARHQCIQQYQVCSGEGSLLLSEKPLGLKTHHRAGKCIERDLYKYWWPRTVETIQPAWAVDTLDSCLTLWSVGHLLVLTAGLPLEG